MKIAVLVKEVPDTYGERRLDLETGLLDRESGEQVLDEINERALEVALQVKDADKSTEVVVVTMGPDSAKDALRKALSMGADRAVHVVDDALEAADALLTARALAAALDRERPDVVVTGNESTDGRGGVVPAMIAEFLGLPLVGSLGSVSIAPDRVRGQRIDGATTATLTASLPAVVSVTEKSAEARFPNFKGIMTAKKKPLDRIGLDDLGLDESAPRSRVLSTAERPAREAGTTIVDDGDAGRRLAEWLASKQPGRA